MKFIPFLICFDAPNMRRHHLASPLVTLCKRKSGAVFKMFEFAVKSRLYATKSILQYFKGTRFFYQETSCHKQIIEELCCGEENGY